MTIYNKPDKEVLANIKQGTFEWINRFRKEWKLKPRKNWSKGSWNDSEPCPIASTIRGKNIRTVVFDGWIRVYKDTDTCYYHYDLPYPAYEFVRYFEEGFYPELVKKEAVK